MSRSSADVLDENGHRPGVRNGYHQQRDVATGAGAVTVTAPRVNDKRVDDETGDRQPDAVPPGHPALTASGSFLDKLIMVDPGGHRRYL